MIYSVTKVLNDSGDGEKQQDLKDMKEAVSVEFIKPDLVWMHLPLPYKYFL